MFQRIYMPLLFVVVLCGCGGQRDEIQYWNGFTGPDGRTMSTMVQQYNQQTCVQRPVTMQRLQWNTYYNKLLITLRYHRAPEVFVLHVNQIPRFAQAGRLADLSDFADRDQEMEQDFLPMVWDAVHWQDKLVALPLDIHPIGMYWNPRLFRAAGLIQDDETSSAPRTLDEFLHAARALTQDHDGNGVPDQWGFVLTWPRTNFISLAEQWGGQLWDTQTGLPTVDCPENIKALEFLVSLYEKHKVMPRPGTVDAWTAFRQGRVGMAFEGIYMLSDLKTIQGLEFAGAPLPVLGKKPAAWSSAHCLALSADIEPDKREEAWAFVRWLSDHSLQWAQGGMIPPRRSLLESPQFNAMQVNAAFAQQASQIVFEPMVPEVTRLQLALDRALSEVFDTQESPAQALGNAQRNLLKEMTR